MKIINLLFLMHLFTHAGAQRFTYRDTLLWHQKEYVAGHEVVQKSDKKFMRFFPVNEKFRVLAWFEKITDTAGFMMATTGAKSKKYFRYGILHFMIGDKALRLTVYRNEKLRATSRYRDHLFVPFTDSTSGEESYGGGRYLDLDIGDIRANQLILDFNKAYNPYCVYAKGFNCPIPPAENDLPVAIRAGEKLYAKEH